MTIEKFAEEYRSATEYFLNLVSSLKDADLDRTNADGWNARQVIHHLADSEAQSYARLRRLIAEPGSIIQGYDEGLWAESATLGYRELPIELSLNVFRAVRAASLMILRRLTPEQLKNAGVHTESGPYSVESWVKSYTNHPTDHAQQILRAIGK